MSLNLKKLREMPGRVMIIDESYDSVAVTPSRSCSIGGPIRMQGQAVQHDRAIFIDLHIQTAAVQTCSRCLTEVISPVALNEHLEFQPESEHLSPLETEAFTYNMQEIELDLRSYVIALVESTLDSKPLCRLDCKGLCSACGQNLNLKQCDCATHRESDPRLKVLKELLK